MLTCEKALCPDLDKVSLPFRGSATLAILVLTFREVPQCVGQNAWCRLVFLFQAGPVHWPKDLDEGKGCGRKGWTWPPSGSGLAFLRKGTLSHDEGRSQAFLFLLDCGMKQSAVWMLTPSLAPRSSLFQL